MSGSVVKPELIVTFSIRKKETVLTRSEKGREALGSMCRKQRKF